MRPRRTAVDVKLRDFQPLRNVRTGTIEGTGGIGEHTYQSSIDVEKSETKGKENVTTAAGSFDCYKIVLTISTELAGMSLPSTVSMFYSPQFGIIKQETQSGGMKTGNIELVKISNN